MHPARIYSELVRVLGDDAVVIGDGGDFVSFAGKYIEPHRPGGWLDPDGNGVHGLNERRSVRSVFVGRDFAIDLVKLYANED